MKEDLYCLGKNSISWLPLTDHVEKGMNFITVINNTEFSSPETVHVDFVFFTTSRKLVFFALSCH